MYEAKENVVGENVSFSNNSLLERIQYILLHTFTYHLYLIVNISWSVPKQLLFNSLYATVY